VIHQTFAVKNHDDRKGSMMLRRRSAQTQLSVGGIKSHCIVLRNSRWNITTLCKSYFKPIVTCCENYWQKIKKALLPSQCVQLPI